MHIATTEKRSSARWRTGPIEQASECANGAAPGIRAACEQIQFLSFLPQGERSGRLGAPNTDLSVSRKLGYSSWKGDR